MTNNDNAIKSILDGVNILVDKKFKKTPILETGVVTAIGTKGYTVKVNNIEYNNINTIGGSCAINETVKVGIPYGNYSRMFIIKGGSGGGVSGVTSVNGKAGEVVLTAGDIGALPNATVIPTKTSQLNNDSGFLSSIPSEYVTDIEMKSYAQPIGNYTTSTQLLTETINRTNADTNLQTQINTLQSKSDVVDIVGTYAELQTYDTSKLGNNDIIKVLEDSTHNNNATYYRWSTTTNTFTYIGQEIDSGTIVTVGGVNQDTWNADTKANLNNPTFTGTVNGITKTMVGLGNVDNVKQYSATNPQPSVIGSSGSSKFLREYQTSRPVSANLTPKDWSEFGGMRKDVSISSTEGRPTPTRDSHLLTMFWDNTGRFDAQLSLLNNSMVWNVPHMQIRGCNNGIWDTTWQTVLDSANYTLYTPTKNGVGANGTWGIDVSGNATTSSSCTGNSATATKATQDANGNIITSTYGASLKISGQTVSLVSKSGTTLSSVTVPMGVMVWQ